MPMDLKQIQKKQNKELIDLVFKKNNTQPFWYFIGTHPTLYDGVGLDTATIDYLNHYFWDYDVRPATFEREYIQHIRQCSAKYNLLKQIELVDEVFEITTNHRITKFIGDTFNRLVRKQENNTTQASTNWQNEVVENDSKNADKKLPMNITGTSFDEIVDWSKGGSNIQENKGKSTDTTNSSNSILQADINKLRDTARQYADNNEELTEVNGLPAEHIEKIWNYIVKDKSIDWLISELKVAFVLVY